MRVFSIPVVQATSPSSTEELDERRVKRAKLAKILEESIAATLTGKAAAHGKTVAKATSRRFG